MTLDHRRFLQSLDLEQRRQLTSLNNRSAITRLSVLILCLCLSSVYIIQAGVFWPLCLVVQGLLLVSLFHLMHECVHDTVFVQRRPNRLAAQICGFILFLPANWFRYFHHAHHRYTNLPEKDPELESVKPTGIRHWLLHVSGMTIWRAQIGLLLSSLYRPINAPYIKHIDNAKVRHEMWLYLTGYVALLAISLVLGTAVLLWVWVVPLLIGQPFLRLYLLAEHTDCEQSTNMLRNTRTVLSNSVVRWFTWNMPYHTEHHVYPTVPFHKLPVLHKLIQSHVEECERGYTAFNKRYVRKQLGLGALDS